jgi:hypothetical protein
MCNDACRCTRSTRSRACGEMTKAAQNLAGCFARHSGRASFKARHPAPPAGALNWGNSAGLLAGR